MAVCRPIVRKITFPLVFVSFNEQQYFILSNIYIEDIRGSGTSPTAKPNQHGITTGHGIYHHSNNTPDAFQVHLLQT